LAITTFALMYVSTLRPTRTQALGAKSFQQDAVSAERALKVVLPYFGIIGQNTFNYRRRRRVAVWLPRPNYISNVPLRRPDNFLVPAMLWPGLRLNRMRHNIIAPMDLYTSLLSSAGGRKIAWSTDTLSRALLHASHATYSHRLHCAPRASHGYFPPPS
jgi:hypothetical protein